MKHHGIYGKLKNIEIHSVFKNLFFVFLYIFYNCETVYVCWVKIIFIFQQQNRNYRKCLSNRNYGNNNHFHFTLMYCSVDGCSSFMWNRIGGWFIAPVCWRVEVAVVLMKLMKKKGKICEFVHKIEFEPFCFSGLCTFPVRKEAKRRYMKIENCFLLIPELYTLKLIILNCFSHSFFQPLWIHHWTEQHTAVAMMEEKN